MTPDRRRAIMVGVVVIAAVFAGCADESTTSEPDETVPAASNASTPVTDVTDGSTAVAGQQHEGFTTIQARITNAEGEVCEVCLWLADTPDERGRGLMEVTDLGDAAGMAFRFDEPGISKFFMLNTPTPLSIAWFEPSGGFVTATDMEPCIEVPDGGCPLYSPGAQIDLAIEVFDGGLEPLGLGPGSRVELIEGSEADRCPLAP